LPGALERQMKMNTNGETTTECAITPQPEKTWKDAPSHKWFKLGAVLSSILAIAYGVALYYRNLQQPNRSGLEVIATAHQVSTNLWQITGQVFLEGKTLPTTPTISSIITDDRGNGFPGALLTNSLSGEFTISALPPLANATNYLEAIIRAQVLVGNELLESRAVLLLTKDRVRPVRIADLSKAFVPLVVVFFGSVLLALVTPGCKEFAALQSLSYYGSLISALLLTVMMVTYIGGVTKLNELCRPGEVLSVGFASIHEGTYLKEGRPEWIFSFTETPVRLLRCPQLCTDSEPPSG